MITDKVNFKALIVSSSEKFAESLSPILASNKISSIATTESGNKAREIIQGGAIDLVVINTPLKDDFGTQLAMDLAEKNLGVLIIVKNDLYDQVSYKVENYGIITLSKPVAKPVIIQAIKFIIAMKIKMEKLEARNSSLESKMKEIRMINRAKWLLIDQMKMSEADAHRYIEKSAMDQCVKKSEIAENIIRTYEV